MRGAVAAGKAAGGFDSIVEASQQMAGLRADHYEPIAKNTPSTSPCTIILAGARTT
jgi:hypothetical protein